MAGPALRLVPANAEALAGPAAAGRVIGAHLRQLREEQRLKLADVAPEVRVSVAKLSRLERGMHPPKEEDVMRLLEFYGEQDPESLDAVRQLLTQAEKAEWWHQFSDVLPGWMPRLIATEAMSTEIRTYHCQYVPGLVQTPEYARAVVSMAFTNPADSARQIDRLVDVRRQRQQILHQAEPPVYSALLDEAILHRTVGSIPVFRAQLRTLHMLEENSDRINIRIVPFSAAAKGVAPAPAMTYLKFASGDAHELIYLEQHPTGGQYLNAREEIDEYQRALMALMEAAADREESMRMLLEAVDRLER
ncbi:helix-turn-helix domain-containing protein [Actinacidiphila sp. bgisy144]|uniref:helix-turn-helix domain-containing protein n=1 Tax=Actinacidiphila sp. bgisy144 TaxID=3413791 RepID=UPI003EBD7088